jgi:hypothetical protein
MTTHAERIDGALLITRGPEMFDGELWIQARVAANDYEAFAKTPQAVSFVGRTFGRTGWNSDTGSVSYSTGVPVARAV